MNGLNHVACESKLRPVEVNKHPGSGNGMAIGHAVAYFVHAAQTFSAGIQCRHCVYASVRMPC